MSKHKCLFLVHFESVIITLMHKLILTRKWKSRYRILFVLIIFLIFASFYIDTSFEYAEKFIKTSYLHDLIQSLSATTTTYEQTSLLNMNQSKIYFLHIPRTASDSIRTHLIGLTPLLYDQSSYNRRPFENNLLITNEDFEQFKNYFIIKGFYSYDDLSKYKIFDQKTNRFITILRHPIERILSLYEFSRHGSLFPSLNRSISLNEFLTINDSIIQSLINNSMTWQIGHHLLMNRRQTFINHSIFDRAKEHLNQFEFIGFYENLMYDYDELNRQVFSKLNHHSYWLDFLFNLGCWFGFFRMRVLKYSARIKHDEYLQQILYQLTYYDMQLYEYAKKDIRQLNFIIFENYSQALYFVFLRICCILFFIFVFYVLLRIRNKKSMKRF